MSTEQPDTDHEVQGTGLDTVVRYTETEQAYGPATIDPTEPKFCPYCGDSATDTSHRLARAYDEVFCDHTSRSTWGYCPGCGEGSRPVNSSSA